MKHLICQDILARSAKSNPLGLYVGDVSRLMQDQFGRVLFYIDNQVLCISFPENTTFETNEAVKKVWIVNQLHVKAFPCCVGPDVAPVLPPTVEQGGSAQLLRT